MTVCRPDVPDLHVTVTADTKLLHVDAAIALLHGAREALRADGRTVGQQAGINTLMNELGRLPTQP